MWGQRKICNPQFLPQLINALACTIQFPYKGNFVNEWKLQLQADLKQHMHNKYRLGHSNQDSVLYQAWKNIEPCRDTNYSDIFRSMPHISENMRATIDKCRTGTFSHHKGPYDGTSAPHAVPNLPHGRLDWTHHGLLQSR